jgi:hypothetical protein
MRKGELNRIFVSIACLNVNVYSTKFRNLSQGPTN